VIYHLFQYRTAEYGLKRAGIVLCSGIQQQWILPIPETPYRPRFSMEDGTFCPAGKNDENQSDFKGEISAVERK